MGVFQMAEKSSGMRELVAVVAGPRGWSDTRESWLARAARRAGVNYRTIKTIYYGELTDERHPAARFLRIEAQRRAARSEGYASRLESAAHTLEHIDPEIHGEDITALRALANRLRNMDD